MMRISQILIDCSAVFFNFVYYSEPNASSASLSQGVDNALFDAPGRGRNAEITDDEKAWIINIACQKPVDPGYAAETWTRALLTKHINKEAESSGHTRLSTISQSKVRTILEEADIKPNKIKYYCENRDPDFDQKMHYVLLVYKQLSLQFDENGQLLPFDSEEPVVHVISYDENPSDCKVDLT